MIPIIIIIVSFLLDGLLTNYLPYVVNDLSWFTPSLTLVSILLIHPFYRKQEKKYYCILFILGLLFDLFYTNLLFYHAVIFVGIGYFIHTYQKWIPFNALGVMIEVILLITIYEIGCGFLLWIFHVVPITFYKVFYKIVHSLLLNVIVAEFIYGMIQLLPKKYKNISMN